MTRQLSIPESLHNELSSLIFNLSTKGFSVTYEYRNYSVYGSVFSFVSGSGFKIEPKQSELFEINGETDYRPSLKDIEDYRDELKVLLIASTEKEVA